MANHIILLQLPGARTRFRFSSAGSMAAMPKMVNAQRMRSGHLCTTCFYSCALSPTHLCRALAYVERNPVRAAMAVRPEEYKWSSAAAHLGLAKTVTYCWTKTSGPSRVALLATPEEAMETRLLRRCTYSGRPFGEEEYVAMFERRFQRVWRTWGFENEQQVPAFAS